MTSTTDDATFYKWAKRFHEQFEKGSRLEKEFILTRTMAIATRRWTAYADGIVRTNTGHARAHWQTLSALTFSEGPVQTLELARRMGLRWPTLIRVLNELEADHLISRERDPDDGRLRLISVTPAGRKLVREVISILNPARSAVLAEFSNEELEITERVMARMLNVLVTRFEN